MKKTKYILIAIGLQLAILAVMGVRTAWPLWTGKPYLLKVDARDPRDIFRGNYVALRYDFNGIYTDSIKYSLVKHKTYHYGDVLYVKLKPRTDGTWATEGIYASKPAEPFLRAVVEQEFTVSTQGFYIYVKCGIEEYFTNKKMAKEIEKTLNEQVLLQKNVLVRVFINSDGQARIDDLLWQEKK